MHVRERERVESVRECMRERVCGRESLSVMEREGTERECVRVSEFGRKRERERGTEKEYVRDRGRGQD